MSERFGVWEESSLVIFTESRVEGMESESHGFEMNLDFHAFFLVRSSEISALVFSDMSLQESSSSFVFTSLGPIGVLRGTKKVIALSVAMNTDPACHDSESLTVLFISGMTSNSLAVTRHSRDQRMAAIR